MEWNGRGPRKRRRGPDWQRSREFVETVRIARRCRAIIFQNFYGTLIVDSIGIGLAAAGFLNPLLAAFIMLHPS